MEAAFGQAKSSIEATYTTAGVLHFQLEPVNALAFERDGVMEIHTGNQAQSFILPVLSKALALPIDDTWKPAVRANLEVSLRLARLVDEFRLPDETEPASVFVA